MPTIPWLKGVTTGGHFLADVSATETVVTVKPLNPEQQTLVVHMADDVRVHRDLRILLNRADIQPPEPGKTLSVAHVNEKLTAARMTPDERITIKRELAAMKFLAEGPAFNIWRQT